MTTIPTTEKSTKMDTLLSTPRWDIDLPLDLGAGYVLAAEDDDAVTRLDGMEVARAPIATAGRVIQVLTDLTACRSGDAIPTMFPVPAAPQIGGTEAQLVIFTRHEGPDPMSAEYELVDGSWMVRAKLGDRVSPRVRSRNTWPS